MNTAASQPLVTVYIPTFNRPAMLERAIRSVSNQTYENLEILVVDDGSRDDVQTTLQALSENYGFTLLKNSQGKGACGARNTAIAAARGKYITGLDDDDEFLPDRVEELVNRFDENRYAAIATTSLVCISDTETVIRNADQGTFTLSQLLHYNKVGNQVLTLTQRLRSIHGFDQAMPAFQDYDAWVRLSQTFGPIEKIDSPTYITHTEHENRISGSSLKKQQGLQLFREKHQALLSGDHQKSLMLLELRQDANNARLAKLLPLLSVNNWKSVASFYLDNRLPRMIAAIRKWKMARTTQ